MMTLSNLQCQLNNNWMRHKSSEKVSVIFLWKFRGHERRLKTLHYDWYFQD